MHKINCQQPQKDHQHLFTVAGLCNPPPGMTTANHHSPRYDKQKINGTLLSSQTTYTHQQTTRFPTSELVWQLDRLYRTTNQKSKTPSSSFISQPCQHPFSSHHTTSHTGGALSVALTHINLHTPPPTHKPPAQPHKTMEISMFIVQLAVNISQSNGHQIPLPGTSSERMEAGRTINSGLPFAWRARVFVCGGHTVTPRSTTTHTTRPRLGCANDNLVWRCCRRPDSGSYRHMVDSGTQRVLRANDRRY